MKHGIYYTKGEHMFARVDSGDMSSEDREYFTHVEFWNQGVMLRKSLIGELSHGALLALSKESDWPEIVRSSIVS